MHVTRLGLVDFRSWTALDVELEPGVTTFVGANGQGKTNIIEALGYAGKRIAVECNGAIVPRSRHADVLLAEGDALEIVVAVGGG